MSTIQKEEPEPLSTPAIAVLKFIRFSGYKGGDLGTYHYQEFWLECRLREEQHLSREDVEAAVKELRGRAWVTSALFSNELVLSKEGVGAAEALASLRK